MLKPKSWKNGVTPMPSDDPELKNWSQKPTNMNCEKTGKSSIGGFWDKPFETSKERWNIRGAGRMGSWECGDILSEMDGGKY
jgi:hypothetical protein